MSAVLAAFMGGLAIGAALGGRAAPQVSERRALQIYAGLELTVAASALLIPWALVLSRPLLAAAYADGAGTWFGVTRLVLSLAMLGVPTAAMGATLPFAARWYLRTMERAGAEAGDLYAGNTIGAATGAGLASFVLVPMLGVRTTLWIAASVNVVAAIVAWAISRRDVDVSGVGRPFRAGNEPRKSKRPADKKSHLTQQPAGTASLTLAAAALALTGFAALVSEVVWARVLALIIGPTTYAFGLMLTTFILGLAAGSFAGARLSARVRDARPSLALVVAAFGVASGAALWRMSGLPIEVAQSIATASGTPFRSVLWRQGIVAASLLLPVAIALGAAFPLAVGVAARTRERVARDLAILYASNTAAAIAGSLAAGFVLIPRFGLRPTIVGMVVLAGLGAGTLAVAGGIARSRVLVLAAVSVAAVALAWTAPRWDHALLSSGAYKYASYLRVPDLEAVLTAGSLEYYKEGAASTVTVRRAAGATMLAIDGKIDASNASDMLTQRLLAHLPLLLHAQPKRVAIVGLGSGVTLGSVLSHGIDQADVLEISPEVIEASARFAEENRHALDDRRTRVITGDGRTHLLLGRNRYDVIISEPSNPWVAGVASLFTREFFEGARDRLADGGVLCQWAHTYDIRDADLRSIVATFAAVFPRGTLWLVGGGDLLLIGSDRPLDGELDQIAARMARPGVAADLADVSVADAASLLSMYVGGPAELRKFGSGARVQSDDRTALEFSAPRGLYEVTGDNASALRALTREADVPRVVRGASNSAQVTAASWRSRGRMLLQAEAYRLAHDAYAQAFDLEPDDVDGADGLVRSAGEAGQDAVEATLTRLRGIVARDAGRGNVAARVALSQLLGARGEIAEAVSMLSPVATDPRVIEQLASLYADQGDVDRLRRVVEQLERIWPDRPGTAYYRATLSLSIGRPQDAIAAAEPAAHRYPLEGRLQNVLGVAYATASRRDEARRAFEAALARDPRDAATYTNLGLLDLETGQADRAVSRFGEALLLDPESARALAALADALDRLGQASRAARIRARRR